MNLLAKNLNVLFFATLILGWAREAYAQVPYTFLRPLPNFPGTLSTDTTLTSYLQNAFYLFLGLSATAAVVIAIAYGFAYMTSDVVIKKESAKKHLTQVALGIGLLLMAYLILYTINPKLVNLDAGLRNLRTTVQSPPDSFARPPVPIEVSEYYSLGKREPTAEESERVSKAVKYKDKNARISSLFDENRFVSICMDFRDFEGVSNRSQCQMDAASARGTFRATCNTYQYAAEPGPDGATEYCICQGNQACISI